MRTLPATWPTFGARAASSGYSSSPPKRHSASPRALWPSPRRRCSPPRISARPARPPTPRRRWRPHRSPRARARAPIARRAPRKRRARARSGSASTLSTLMKRAIASRARRGSGCISLSITALDAGTQTSNFGNWTALTIAFGDLLGGELLHPAGVGQPAAQLGVDHGGHHHRDLDPAVAELGADGLAQADDRVLGRAVGGAPRNPGLARLGGDVDDVAAASLPHPGNRQLHPVDDAVEVDVDHPPAPSRRPRPRTIRSA